MAERRLCSYRLRFRVTTPLFLGGAEPNDRAELRPASIKGVLRDWYRVLVGAEQAARDEARYFGGAAAGAGQSPFLLAADRALTGEQPWERQRVSRDAVSGLNYLGYSLDLGRNSRKAIPGGATFELEAVFPRGAEQPLRRVFLSCAWLMAHLGGLGTRSRRGFGSLALESWEGPKDDPVLPELPLLRAADAAPAAAARLGAALERLRGWFHPEDRSSPGKPPLGFRLDGARIVVVAGPNRAGAWERPSEALEQVGAALQGFRRQPGIDGFPTTRLLASGERPPRAPARTAFGLPLSYRGRGRTDTFEPYLPGDPPSAGRTAGRGARVQVYRRFPSPLLIQVQEIAGGFLPIVTLLGGAWPGRDLPVQVGGQGCPEDPGNRLPAQFLDLLVSEGAREVEVPR